MKYTSGAYTQGQLCKDIFEIELALTRRYEEKGAITTDTEQNTWRDAVIATSFGKNTVMFDDLGNPSVMVIINAMTRSQVIGGVSQDVHPAFLVGATFKKCFYVCKYNCTIVGSGTSARAVSLRNYIPRPSLYANSDFDTCIAACRQKGSGWHLITNVEWMAIAGSAYTKGFVCRGNTANCKSSRIPSEIATPAMFVSNLPTYCMTGSGPITWSHDGTPYGVYDMAGNLHEWVAGLRVSGATLGADGEINIFNNNDASADTADFSSSSASWKAILEDGTLVAPGTVDTLKYSDTVTIVKTANLSTTRYYDFKTISSALVIPDILKLQGVYPVANMTVAVGNVGVGTNENYAQRGGAYADGTLAGMFALNLVRLKTKNEINQGFRAAFLK